MSNEEKKQATNELTVKYDVDGQEVKLTPSIVQQYIVGAENA